MNLHNLKNSSGAKSSRIRKGRGMSSGKGKTCGRGHKGQMSRSGSRHKPTFEGGQMPLVRRIPKRGFNNYTRQEAIPVNLSDLDRLDAGVEVTPDALRAAGLAKGTCTRIKILGKGTLTKSFTVKAHAFSETAKSAIEAQGGSCEVIG